MKELLPHEVAKLKKAYERVQGGYRIDEATAMEAYVFGRIFMQLKKYYPRVLLNAMSSKRMEMDMGYLKKDAGGEDIRQ